MNISIIFIHKGNPYYLRYALNQAKVSNPSATIYLVGDETNNIYPFVTHLNYKDFFSNATQLATLYQHQSVNSIEFELFCFQRWLILDEFVKRHNLIKFVYLDSDVMLYTNIDVIFSKYNNIDIAGFYGGSPHIIYFATASILNNFSKFIVSIFKQPDLLTNYKDIYKGCDIIYNIPKETIAANEIKVFSDMIIFQCFLIDNHSHFKNLHDIDNNGIFDVNINMATEYKLDEKKKIKIIKWIDNKPHYYNLRLEAWVQVFAIHFQGGAKQLIPVNTTYTKNMLQKLSDYLLSNIAVKMKRNLIKLINRS